MASDNDPNSEDILNMEITHVYGSHNSLLDSPILQSGTMQLEDDGGNPINRTIKKRLREEYGESDSEWTLVQRKQKIRKEEVDKVEIYITSKDKLPKQFALAKIFSENNIQDVLGVKYLSHYKIRIDLSNEESALKLEKMKYIEDKGWRCQRAMIKNISYGVIKNMDLDITEEEIKTCMTCVDSDIQILSVNHLKKRNFNNTDDEDLWTPSEAIRIGFKGPLLPAYVIINSLRIRVDPYIFPVTQCSRCWKFGHPAKICPSKKIICPKCGEPHANCDTHNYKCINCNGKHMALMKTCPVFIKQKKIRDLMAEFNCTYQKAMTMYVPHSPYVDTSENFPLRQQDFPDLQAENTTLNPTINVITKTFAEAAKSKKERKNVIPKKKNLQIKENDTTDSINNMQEDVDEALPFNCSEENINEKSEERSKDKSNHSRQVHFEELVLRIKEILFLQRDPLGTKFKMILKCCIEWLILVVVDNLSDWPTLKNMFNYING